jgi:DnaK suppressor protein
MARFQASSFINTSSFHPVLLDQNDYMSTKTLGLFKEFLILWKKALIADSQVDMEVLKEDVHQTSADLSDQATYEENICLHARTRDRERKLMKKIDEALIFIERGDYGYCIECGVEIGYERMIARPTAEMCIDCKTAAEIKERHTGHYSDGSDD